MPIQIPSRMPWFAGWFPHMHILRFKVFSWFLFYKRFWQAETTQKRNDVEIFFFIMQYQIWYEWNVLNFFIEVTTIERKNYFIFVVLLTAKIFYFIWMFKLCFHFRNLQIVNPRRYNIVFVAACSCDKLHNYQMSNHLWPTHAKHCILTKKSLFLNKPFFDFLLSMS